MSTHPLAQLPRAVLAGLQSLSPAQLARLTEAEQIELQSLIEAEYQDGVDRLCSENLASESRGPLYWGQNWTKTENPKWEIQGLPFKGPFPRKSYFVPLFEAFFRERRLFVPKTREMLTSWCVMLYATHQAQWRQKEIIVQTGSEGKAHELVGYAQQLYENQPDWLRARHPKSGQSMSEISWAGGGRILAIPAGVDKIRLYHPTVYVMDEAAFLPEAQQCYDNAQPVAAQIIAISSAGPGWFGDECTL